MAGDLPRFGAWQAVERLGRGGMSTVWRVRHAEDPAQERALKVLHDSSPGSAQRFVAEARLLSELNHPHVLRVHALEDAESPPWIVMELLAGRDLQEELDRRPIEPERAARWVADIASGLTAVHARGVRHRDIKPANIMLGRDGVARLIDFGIARDVSRGHMTAEGFVVGTAAYLPPEVFDEEGEAHAQDSEAADVYALGQTLCELLIGQPIFPRDADGPAALARILREKLDRSHLDPCEWRPHVPEDLAEIVRRATRREPEQRTASARDLEDRLRGWIATRRGSEAAPITRGRPASLPPPPGSGTQPPAPKHSGLVMSAGLGGLAVGLLLLGTLLAAVGLWVLRPAPLDASVRSALAAQLRAQSGNLVPCARLGGTPGQEIIVELQLRSGRVQVAELRSSHAPEAVERCVLDALEPMQFAQRDSVRLRLPIQFGR